MAHTVIPPPRGTTTTLELTHKGNTNDKTIPERDREVRDFNVIVFASVITRHQHLVIDTHKTDLGVTRQGCHHIHEMIVTANRTCVLLASEDMITPKDPCLSCKGKACDCERGQASWGWALRNSCRKKPAKRPVGNELQTFANTNLYCSLVDIRRVVPWSGLGVEAIIRFLGSGVDSRGKKMRKGTEGR